MNFETFHKLEKAFVGQMYEGLRCGCPDLTLDELRDAFMPGPEMILKKMQTDQDGYAAEMRAIALKCPDLKGVFGDFMGAHLTTERDDDSDMLTVLPKDSCSYKTWNQGRGCAMQLPMTFLKLDMALTVTVARCPAANSALPYFEIGCRGNGCMNWCVRPPVRQGYTGTLTATPTRALPLATTLTQGQNVRHRRRLWRRHRERRVPAGEVQRRHPRRHSRNPNRHL